jgi:hypothetical protein
MVDASMRAGPKFDEHGQVVAPPDPNVQEEMDELGDRLVELRNKLLHDAWRVIHHRPAKDEDSNPASAAGGAR